MNLFFKYIHHFIELIYPNNCYACGAALQKGEEIICTKCLYNLPKTHYHKTPEQNPVAELFYGLTSIKYATAYYVFDKGSIYRPLIHHLKYKNAPEIGVGMGKYFGGELNGSAFDEIDLLVPVPLHPAKKRIRGYNQSDAIVAGMSESTGIEADYKSLIRHVFTETQTKKNLTERRENVKSVFAVKNPEAFKGKHVLIIDDVVTTGSTLVACADEILKIPGTTVSIACLAVAKH